MAVLKFIFSTFAYSTLLAMDHSLFSLEAFLFVYFHINGISFLSSVRKGVAVKPSILAPVLFTCSKQ